MKKSAIASRVLRVISGAHYWNQVREFSQFCVLLVFGDEEIGRLDVAMDHVLAVKKRPTGGQSTPSSRKHLLTS